MPVPSTSPEPPDQENWPPPELSALDAFSTEQKIALLTLVYNKQVGTLAAIESSQQALLNLVLGIYSAALTLLVGLFKDEQQLLHAGNGFLSPLGWVLVAAGISLAAYSYYMSSHRDAARKSSRRALERIDFAFRYFEDGVYLEHTTLYPPDFRKYTAKRTFLQIAPLVVYLPAAVFVFAVIVLSHADMIARAAH